MAAEHVAPKAAGVALIAADTGRVLMLQRAHDDPDDPAAGTWEFPGGHVESSDDSSLHGAIREWQEEVGRRMPKGATVALAWRSKNGVYAGHVLVIPSEEQVDLSGRRVVANPDDDSEQRAWWQIEHARKNPALRAEARHTPWDDMSRIAREAQKRMNTKDVYASMAPATYTRGLGSGVGRAPVVIERHAPPPLALAARRLRRRPLRSGAKALTDARARLETKLDPEILEIYRGARAETKVRHVRTAAGVRRYHAPIGTPIIGGRAVPSLPSAGGGRPAAGRNAGRATTGLVGGSSRRGGAGKARGGFTGRSRRGGLGKRLARRAVFGGGGGGGNLGGGAGGLGAIGQLFGGGKEPAAGAQPKKKKEKKPKQVKPPKVKKGSSTRGSGVGKGHTGKTDPSKKPTPTQPQLDDAAAQLVDVPVERLSGILRTMPANVLPMLLDTIKDPEFAKRVAAASARGGANAPVASGAKSLSFGAAWLDVKDAAAGDERCMGCGVDLDPGEDYATVPTGKGYELVVCPPCAEETKAGRGSGDSGIPGHLPEQLRRYWTSGKGKARWAASPHPYTALVNGLRSEGVPGKVIHGLAANLFKDVFGIFPAQRPRALGGSTHGYAR